MKAKKPLPRKFHVCTYIQNFNTMLRQGVITESICEKIALKHDAFGICTHSENNKGYQQASGV